MQTRVSSKKFEKFYFEIPSDRKDVIEAINGLLLAFKIDNDFSSKKEDTVETKEMKVQNQLKEFESVVGTVKIDKRPTKEEVREARVKKYVK